VSNHDEEVQRESEGVRVTDRRRIDPDTFEVRQPGAGAPDDLETEAAVVEGDVLAVEAKVAELTEDLQRVHAEYANYRKRVERDREMLRDIAIANAMVEILPVLDDVDRAREHDELHGAFKTVGENLEQALTKLGLERFGTEGEAFDPNMHEALTSEASDEVSEPTVIRIYQPGYRFADRVLRPARVAVAGTD
jgi:molecular chaperone GrpE